MFSHNAFKTVMISLYFWFSLLSGSASAGQPGLDGAPLLQEFEQARQSVSGFKVESAEAFKKITDYYSQVMNDPAVVHRFETQDGNVILCVDIRTQESVRTAGIPPEEITLGPVLAPEDGKSSSLETSDHVRPKLPGSQWLDGSVDRFGQQRICPDNAFPKLAPRLENLYRFRSLDDYFSKYLSGGNPPAENATQGAELRGQGIPAAAGGPVYRYAFAGQNVTNVGGGADFNVWSPCVAGGNEASLNQLWIMAGTNAYETVELGWQKYPRLYGDQKTHLFIYYIGKNSIPGCFDLTCKAFVQTNKSVVIGGPIEPVSAYGGNQVDVVLDARQDPTTHDWRLYYNGNELGYYPASLFSMLENAGIVEFGGQVVDNGQSSGGTSTWMGSGHLPDEGFQKAAFIRQIHYYADSTFTPSDTGFLPSTLYTVVGNNVLYDISTIETSQDSTWGNYFYYGGPGAPGGPCSPVNGACGSAGEKDFVTTPASNLCGHGKASKVTANTAQGTWNWTCVGVNGGSTMSCSADIEVIGACGSANRKAFYDPPASNLLCRTGTASAVSPNTAEETWSWSCAGANGGTTAGCSAKIEVDGACGSSNEEVFTSAPTTNLCSAGTASRVTANTAKGTWNWTCHGANGGKNIACSATKAHSAEACSCNENETVRD